VFYHADYGNPSVDEKVRTQFIEAVLY